MNILLLNQCFYPDVVSTAQHSSDLVAALTDRGHDVTVVTSSRAYDNPQIRFPREERWHGSRIIRVPCLGLGKSARWRRAVTFCSFFLSCILRLLLLPRFDVVVALTSPPLISLLGALFVKLKGGRFMFWVMDLNPDQAVAAGWLRKNSATAKVLERILSFSVATADTIVVLDRFMSERIGRKGVKAAKMCIIPPWAHSQAVSYDPDGRRAFRERHGLTGKYVVMYSGNHSPCHPLDTLLEAARRLSGHPEIAFCFIGGGAEFAKVQMFATAHRLDNILCLPYEPLHTLSASLSAADLHIVVMGKPFVGIVHPCKLYNILCIGIPVLYIGPRQSPIADIASANSRLPVGITEHGDVESVVRQIQKRLAGRIPDLRLQTEARQFSQERLLPQLTALIESLPGTLPAAVPVTPSSAEAI